MLATPWQLGCCRTTATSLPTARRWFLPPPHLRYHWERLCAWAANTYPRVPTLDSGRHSRTAPHRTAGQGRAWHAQLAGQGGEGVGLWQSTNLFVTRRRICLVLAEVVYSLFPTSSTLVLCGDGKLVFPPSWHSMCPIKNKNVYPRVGRPENPQTLLTLHYPCCGK